MFYYNHWPRNTIGTKATTIKRKVHTGLSMISQSDCMGQLHRLLHLHNSPRFRCPTASMPFHSRVTFDSTSLTGWLARLKAHAKRHISLNNCNYLKE